MPKLPNAPTTWEDFESLKEYLTDCDVMFLRTKKDQEAYEKYQKSMKRDDFLSEVSSQIDGKVALIQNKFPHSNVLKNFPNALHYCLWSLNGELESSEIQAHVEKKFTDRKWFSMTRKPGMFSIPEIWHAHIYIK